MAPSGPPSGFEQWLSESSRPSNAVPSSPNPTATTDQRVAPGATPSTTQSADAMPQSIAKKGKGKGKGKKFTHLDWNTNSPVDMTSATDYTRSSAPARGYTTNAMASSSRDAPPAQNNWNRTSRPSGNPSRNLSKQMGNLSLTQGQKMVRNTSTGVTLMEFHKFPELPFEIRREIWGLICVIPRLLEVSWDFADKNYEHKEGEHYYYRLAPRSCLPPAIMHVNQEAREEAKFHYKPVVMTTNPRKQNSANTYAACEAFETFYNPTADIVLFAENTCLNTLVRFLDDQRLRNVQVNQVAILLSGKVIRCHDWNHDDPIHGPDDYHVDLGYSIAGGCTVMQALHGIHKKRAWTTMASGVKGLKEVFFVVHTHLTCIVPGTVDESIWFREACGDGLTTGQVEIKRKIEDDVRIVESSTPLPNCGGLDNWTRTEELSGDDNVEKPLRYPQAHHERQLDNKAPTFRFVSFSPAPNVGEVFDAITIPEVEIPKLNVHDWAFMKKIEYQTRVHIKVPEQHFPRQIVREIGFYGKEEGVAKAKQMIAGRLEIMSGKKWNQRWELRKQGYRGTGKVEYSGAGRSRTTAAAAY